MEYELDQKIEIKGESDNFKQKLEKQIEAFIQLQKEMEELKQGAINERRLLEEKNNLELQSLSDQIEKLNSQVKDLQQQLEYRDEFQNEEKNKYQKKYDALMEQIKYNEQIHQQQLEEIREEYQHDKDRLIIDNKKELNSLVADFNDKINKLESKIRSQTIDLQNSKQDYSNLYQKQDGILRVNERNLKKMEKIQHDLKNIRDELIHSRRHNEQLIKQYEELESKMQRVQKSKEEADRKVGDARDMIEQAEQLKNKMIREKEILMKMYTEQLEAKDIEIKQQIKQLSEKDNIWKKKLMVQKVKYEKTQQEETQEYQLKDKETQFGIYLFLYRLQDSPELQQKFDMLEQCKIDLEKQILDLDNQIGQMEQGHAQSIQELQEKMNTQLRKQIKEQNEKFQQEILKMEAYNKQETERIQQSATIKSEQIKKKCEDQLYVYERKIDLLEVDLEKRDILISDWELKYSKLDSTLHSFLDENLKFKEEQESLRMYIQQQCEEQIDVIKQESETKIETLKVSIDNLQKQCLLLNNLRQSDLQLLTEQKSKMSQDDQKLKQGMHEQMALRKEITGLNKELNEREQKLIKFSEIIKQWRHLQLEIENYKDVYNIFRGNNSNGTMKPRGKNEENVVKPGWSKVMMAKSKEPQQYGIKDPAYMMNFNLQRTQKMPKGRITRQEGVTQSQPSILEQFPKLRTVSQNGYYNAHEPINQNEDSLRGSSSKRRNRTQYQPFNSQNE